MNLKKAKRLQQIMPYKKIFYDMLYNCYRLIKPSELYEYQDEECKNHKRPNTENLKLWA